MRKQRPALAGPSYQSQAQRNQMFSRRNVGVKRTTGDNRRAGACTHVGAFSALQRLPDNTSTEKQTPVDLQSAVCRTGDGLGGVGADGDERHCTVCQEGRRRRAGCDRRTDRCITVTPCFVCVSETPDSPTAVRALASDP